MKVLKLIHQWIELKGYEPISKSDRWKEKRKTNEFFFLNIILDVGKVMKFKDQI
jgi:hypothetical protein